MENKDEEIRGMKLSMDTNRAATGMHLNWTYTRQYMNRQTHKKPKRHIIKGWSLTGN